MSFTKWLRDIDTMASQNDQLDQENMSLRLRNEELEKEVAYQRHQLKHSRGMIDAIRESNNRLRRNLNDLRDHQMEVALDLGEAKRANERLTHERDTWRARAEAARQ